jgi:RimJ/RimL family protein N-acetyltransferase
VTILVDACTWPHRGGLWCHLVSDLSFDELHAFARRLGVPRAAFQGDHYDLDERRREHAIAQGAVAVDGRDIVSALRSAGLRRGPALAKAGLRGVAHLGAPMLRTERLLLRQWRVDDLGPLAEIHADPRVGEWLGGALGKAASTSFVDRQAVGLALRGVGMFAVERVADGVLIGAVGLGGVGPDFPFGPAIEVAWRLGAVHQGSGYATEAAGAALRYGLATFDVPRIAAFTASGNGASIAVMERLGMRADRRFPEFDHPRLAVGHPLRRHVLRWSHDGSNAAEPSASPSPSEP